MSQSMAQQKLAVQSGHWPLYRYRPGDGHEVQPLQLDSAAPSVPWSTFAATEGRFNAPTDQDPQHATELAHRAADDVSARWAYYEHLAATARSAPAHVPPADAGETHAV